MKTKRTPEEMRRRLDEIREFARTGRYSRQDLARLFATNYDRICEICHGINMPQAFGDRTHPECHTVFDEIEMYRHDEDFIPRNENEFLPTSARPGSAEKVDILARRVQMGQPLWHRHDFHCGGSGAYIGKDGPGIRYCDSSTPSRRKAARD